MQIKHKSVVFVVSGYGLALLGMPAFEKLELLTVNCTTVDESWKKEQVNKQLRQQKSFLNKDLKINLLTAKNENEIDYSIAGPGKEANIASYAKITWEMPNDYNDVFFRNWVVQRHIYPTG